MTYTYYFRSLPDPRKVMPLGMMEMNTHRQPEYDSRFHCDVYGRARFNRPLSIDEMQENDLMPDPKNHLVGMMKGPGKPDDLQAQNERLRAELRQRDKLIRELNIKLDRLEGKE